MGLLLIIGVILFFSNMTVMGVWLEKGVPHHHIKDAWSGAVGSALSVGGLYLIRSQWVLFATPETSSAQFLFCLFLFLGTCVVSLVAMCWSFMVLPAAITGNLDYDQSYDLNAPVQLELAFPTRSDAH